MEPVQPLPDELTEHLLSEVALTGTWGEFWDLVYALYCLRHSLVR